MGKNDSRLYGENCGIVVGKKVEVFKDNGTKKIII